MQYLNSFAHPAVEDHPWPLLLTVLPAPASQTSSSIANLLFTLLKSRLNKS